jgi:tripartite-type tricarboxylate transporter receptor subunit TctC
MPHLAGALFGAKAGIGLSFVPHPSVPQSLQDVVSGRIPIIVEGMAGLSGAIQGGLIKPLAVTSAKRLPRFPDVPAVAEFIPGFSVTAWFALMAPAKTPPEIVQQISRDLRVVVAQPNLQEKFDTLGAYVRPTSPAETADFIREQQASWWPIVRQILAPQ